MISDIKLLIKEKVEKHFSDKHNVTINVVVEKPKKVEAGDLSIPLFTIIQEQRNSPYQVWCVHPYFCSIVIDSLMLRFL